MLTDFLRQGLHDGISMDRYIRDPAPEPSLSKGIISTMLEKSPLHAKLEHPRLNPCLREDESSRADLGTAVHSRILGGEKAIVVVSAEDWKTKAAREQRDAARADGKTPILTCDADRLEAIAASVTSKLTLAGMPFSKAKCEQTGIWQDDDGIWCRMRPDMVWDKVIGDLKTSTNASPQNWIRTTLNRTDYPIQASHYTRGMSKIDGVKREFRFVVVELLPPHACSIVALDPEYLVIANEKCTAARKMWAHCLKTNEWPGYSTEVFYARCPSWEMATDDTEITIDGEKFAA
jgi:PDDEXK-like domain of unknown function (DUF3799)